MHNLVTSNQQIEKNKSSVRNKLNHKAILLISFNNHFHDHNVMVVLIELLHKRERSVMVIALLSDIKKCTLR